MGTFNLLFWISQTRRRNKTLVLKYGSWYMRSFERLSCEGYVSVEFNPNLLADFKSLVRKYEKVCPTQMLGVSFCCVWFLIVISSIIDVLRHQQKEFPKIVEVADKYLYWPRYYKIIPSIVEEISLVISVTSTFVLTKVFVGLCGNIVGLLKYHYMHLRALWYRLYSRYVHSVITAYGNVPLQFLN